MINNVSLTGRAGRDPEKRFTQAGEAVTQITIGVQRNKDTTDWFDVKFWGKTAETAAQYLKKGHLFGVSGQLRQEKWQDDNGNNRSKTVVNGQHLALLQPRDKGSEESIFDGYNVQD